MKFLVEDKKGNVFSLLVFKYGEPDIIVGKEGSTFLLKKEDILSIYMIKDSELLV